MVLDLADGDVSVSRGTIGISSGPCNQVAACGIKTKIKTKQVRKIFRKEMCSDTGLILTRGDAMAKQEEKTVTGRVLHDPVKDKLRPMFPLDLSKVRRVDELVRAMGDTAFTGRQIGDDADVLEAMARDKDCFVVMTLSGAMTVAKMGLVFCDLMEAGIVNAIVSTGALMAHGLVEATGLSHFRYDPKMDDRELFHAGYNRVYDSLEPETNLDHVEAVGQQIFREWDNAETVCSWKIHRRIGENLVRHAKGRGILKSTYQYNVPVFVPPFTDSELRLELALHTQLRLKI